MPKSKLEDISFVDLRNPKSHSDPSIKEKQQIENNRIIDSSGIAPYIVLKRYPIVGKGIFLDLKGPKGITRGVYDRYATNYPLEHLGSEPIIRKLIKRL